MRGVYRAQQALPHLGVEQGDTVIIDPEHPRAPIQVVKLHSRHRLPDLVSELDSLTFLSPLADRPPLDPPSPGAQPERPESRHRRNLRLLP